MPAPLSNSAAMDALVEELLTKDVYIVDYLPRTVPQNSGGQYFDVEYYLLNSPRYTALKDKFSSVIFKLMCYYRVCIPWDGGWVDQPNPELIDHIIAEIMDCHSGTLTCLFPDELALLVFDWDCLNLTTTPAPKCSSCLHRLRLLKGCFSARRKRNAGNASYSCANRRTFTPLRP